MVAWENLVRMIAGRGSAEKCEQRQLKRQYKHVEEMMKNVTLVTNESLLDSPGQTPSIATRYTTPNHEKFGSSLRSAHPTTYERCASSPTLPTLTTFKSLCGPPDITARDLTQDECKRNYSQDNVWNVHEQPLPPMPQMSGFGRYRRSIDATPEWQMEHLDRHLYDVKSLLVNQPGDHPPAGLDPQSWRMYRAHHSRNASAASSRSSDVGRPSTVPEEYLDMKTGTRISRGFCPSTTSSANSSFKEGYSYYRRDSNLSSLSMTSPTSDVDQKFLRRSNRPVPSRRTSRQGSTCSMTGLGSILETHEALPQPLRKIEKPCEFNDMDNSENAVASDDDEEADNLHWNDVLEVNGAAQQSNLSKGLRRMPIPRAGPSARPLLTRQRTSSDEKNGSRGLKRTIFERTKSRRTVTRVPTQTQLQKKPMPCATKSVKESSEEIEIEKRDLQTARRSASSALSQKMDIPRKRTGVEFSEKSMQASGISVDTGKSGCINATPSPEQMASHALASSRSDTSHETLFISGQPKQGFHTPCRGRYRSGTTTTIRPGHCPERDL